MLLNQVLEKSLSGGLPVLIMSVAIALGAFALLVTPREEEPQIVVPSADVLIQAPGLDARQVERLVATPVEKLLAQIDGVEHVYSVSHAGRAVVSVSFYVGIPTATINGIGVSIASATPNIVQPMKRYFAGTGAAPGRATVRVSGIRASRVSRSAIRRRVTPSLRSCASRVEAPWRMGFAARNRCRAMAPTRVSASSPVA